MLSGLLVKVDSEQLEYVLDELEKITGVDVSSILDEGKIVVVIDSSMITDESRVTEQIGDISGVKGIYPAYRHLHEGETDR